MFKLKRYLPLLSVCYPIVVHIVVLLQHPQWAVFALALLLSLFLWDMAFSIVWKILLSITFISIASVCLYYRYVMPIYIYPSIISALMLWLFARSLRPGSTPLITAILMRIQPQTMSEDMYGYTRKLTLVWVVFLSLMLLETIFFAVFAPIALWSLFCNILNYVFMGLMFVVEAIYRRWRFGSTLSLWQLIRKLPKIDMKTTMMKLLPILQCKQLDDDFVYLADRVISYRQFLADVEHLQARLPQRKCVINLCQNRYYFLVSFFAVLLSQQITFLPNNDKKLTLKELADSYPDIFCLSDSDDIDCEQMPLYFYQYEAADKTQIDTIPCVDAEQIAAVVFTSGSTGKAEAHQKHWGYLVEHAFTTAQALGLNADEKNTIVSTVPMQHMYGLEHSVILPMQLGYTVQASKPFYPADISETLSNISGDVVLCSTPLHLKFCLDSDISFPSVRLLLSSTAFLSQVLAKQVETMFDTRLLEIYGATETGAMATRETSKTTVWKTLQAYELQHRGDAVYLFQYQGEQGHYDVVRLNDNMELLSSTEFKLLGRESDMIKIAGKRASLADITIKLNKIPGVKDGVVVLADKSIQHEIRLVAFVVAPEISEKAILQQLRDSLDPVFLPRPVIHVNSLPRNSIGKLAYDKLKALLEKHV